MISCVLQKLENVRLKPVPDRFVCVYARQAHGRNVTRTLEDLIDNLHVAIIAGGTQALRMQVREWHAMGLPHDAVSVDSAIVAMHGRCWPLCIDPQVQLGDR